MMQGKFLLCSRLSKSITPETLARVGPNRKVLTRVELAPPPSCKNKTKQLMHKYELFMSFHIPQVKNFELVILRRNIGNEFYEES